MAPRRGKMSRSVFLMGVAGSATLAALRLRMPAAAESRPRNVLWIVDDDHPPYMMGSRSQARARIGAPGSDHRQGHADIPLCGPARESLLTGLSVTTHRCDTNEIYPQVLASPLGLEDMVVARHLRSAGYATGHFGKYVNVHARSSGGTVPPH